MLVTWNWLKQFVPLDMALPELEHRLSMAGLNHDGTTAAGDDWVINLEVTSNRPDCLGHIGIAREIAVLWNHPLTIPDPRPPAEKPSAGELVRVEIRCPELCQRYTARVVRGVKIGPSPGWLADRLASIGVAAVNNVVDISNHVMMECGQPLHAFDYQRLEGGRIVVREAVKGERFEAIDHRQYELDAGMCVIADARTAVALGGVMGGAHTEISASTTDILVEAASFHPMSIRATARRLNLHSPSSYRFERGTDPGWVDWASRRCCEWIVKLAGGTLAEGVVDVGPPIPPPEPITLRLPQLARILGIDIPAEEVARILSALGLAGVAVRGHQVQATPPSWRRDLAREIDLIEEVARIHGYDAIPEDVAVPMAPSHRTDRDRVVDRVRRVVTAAGYDEAMTASVVEAAWAERFSPWTDEPAITTNMPMLKGADVLRRSLVPSLLEARRINESLANADVRLFETAAVYLADHERTREPLTLALCTGGGFLEVKGVVEALLAAARADVQLELRPARHRLLEAERSAELWVGDRRLGILGELSHWGRTQSSLRQPATVAEVDLEVLIEHARLVPVHRDQSPYPSMTRDLNLIVDESVKWSELDSTVRQCGGILLEDVRFLEVYRDPNKDGPGKKRMLFSVSLRAAERTLTNQEADGIRDAVVRACGTRHSAVLLG